MPRLIILLIGWTIFSANIKAMTALEELRSFNRTNIQNKEEKEKIINIINGNSKGLNYNAKLSNNDLKTLVNAAQKPVLVNGAYYDWFDILKASLDQNYKLDTQEQAYKVGDTSLQRFLEKLYGDLWFSAHLAHAFKDHPDLTRKYVVHQACYYMINRYLQNEAFKMAVYLNPRALATDIYNKLKAYRFTTFYTDLSEKEAIAQIEKYGKRILELKDTQRSPIDLSGVTMEGDQDKYIKIEGVYPFRHEENEDPYQDNPNPKNFANTGQILRVGFNKENEVIGLDYPYKNPPQLLSGYHTQFATYQVPRAIQKLTERWGMVASPLNIENGQERNLYLFWISTDNTSGKIDPQTGVLYGYLDINFLPAGGKGEARVGRLIQLSTMPKGVDMQTILGRRQKLEDTLNHWRSNLYPLQLFKNSFDPTETKQYKISLNVAYEIFSRLSTFDPRSNPWFILTNEEGVIFNGFPSFKIGKTLAQTSGIKKLEVNTLKMQENGTLLEGKETVKPTYFLSPLEALKYKNIQENNELTFYLIEHNNLIEDDFGQQWHISANDFLFTPKILYCAYKPKQRPNSPITLFQASAGTPTPQMLMALYQLKLKLSLEEEADINLYEEESYKELGIPDLLAAAFPGQAAVIGVASSQRTKLQNLTLFKKHFGIQ